MTFKVPLGFDSDKGDYVLPINALKTAIYYCPGCKSPLVFKDGAIKAKHFAHKYGCGCNYDTFTHNLAIQVILDHNNILIDQGIVHYSNQRKEVVIGQHRIDLVIDAVGYEELLVEVVVKSPLTVGKLDALAGYSILEIDLSEIDPFPDIMTFVDLVLYEESIRTLYSKKEYACPDLTSPTKKFWIACAAIVVMVLAFGHSRGRKRMKY